MRQIVVSKGIFYIKVALLEEGMIRQLDYYPLQKGIEKGNVYKGIVERVIPAMGAAFVKLEEGETGFLPLEKKTLKGSQVLMVQVIKEATGQKKPMLSEEISFSGKHLVFLPHGTRVMRSRKSTSEAESWANFLEKYFPQKGFILRSGLGNPTEKEITDEVQDLLEQWDRCYQKFHSKNSGTLIHENPQRAWQQFFIQQYDKKADEIICNDKTLLKEIRVFLQGYYEIQEFRLEESILSHKYGIHPELLLKNSFEKGRLRLSVEQTEALCVIDVDSGYQNRFGDFEDTACHVNKEACSFIVDVVMLKDLSGIILVDFINMKEQKNKDAVLEQLRKEFEKDWKKISVEGMTSIGLVQILRQREKEDKVRRVAQNCPSCHGTGKILRGEILLDILEDEIRLGLEHRDSKGFEIQIPREGLEEVKKHQKQLESHLCCTLKWMENGSVEVSRQEE